MNTKSMKAAAVLMMLAAVVAGAAEAPKARHYTRPVQSIMVKVVTHSDYEKKAAKADATVMPNGQPAPWIVTSYGAMSCTAWVDGGSKVMEADLLAYKACRKVLRNQ